MPFAKWCSACVQTRSRADAHRPQQTEVQLPILQMDFYFTGADPQDRPANVDDAGDKTLCCLIAVDLDTRMVLAVPCPGIGAGVLFRCTQEVSGFSMSIHGEEAVIVQSDGEPAIKAVVRAVAQTRSRLGRRTVQRTTPVGDHQANGAAERAVQTVRRLSNCLLVHFEEMHGKLPPDADLRAWSHSHASFLYNRFNVLAGPQRTPYEIAYGGKQFQQKLCVFGEVVFGKVPRTHKAESPWILGMWVGISEHNSSDCILSEHGFVEVTSVRRAAKEFQVSTAELLDKYHGLPWEKNVVEKKRRKRAAVLPVVAPLALEVPDAGNGGAGAEPAGAPESRHAAPGTVDEAASDPPSSEELVPDVSMPPVPARPLTPEKRKLDDTMFAETEAAEANQEAEVVHAPAESSDFSSGAVREVETVDAQWFDAPEVEETVSDGDWEFVDAADETEPPNIGADELLVLDQAAESYETERLVEMGVLKKPAMSLDNYEKLTVTFVNKWKLGGEKQGWWRRARLVARQFKWASMMGDEETFSPASVAPLSRHLILLAQEWGTPIWVCDIKDAYLNVEQPEDEPVVVLIGSEWWQLGRVLPGQRRGAQVWWNQLRGDLSDTHMEGLPEVPTLMRNLKARQATQVHVDDMQLTGDDAPTQEVISALKKKYVIKVEGPFSMVGDEWEFLKRRYTLEGDYSITVRPAAHFYQDIYDLLECPRHRTTAGPGGGDSLFQVDDSKALSSAQAKLFRTIVGKLLYISGERPDAQVVIQYLAGKASQPTERALKVLKHLAGFLHSTRDYGINLKNQPGISILRDGSSSSSASSGSEQRRALVEAISDSNFANDRETRKSLSCGQVYVNRALAYSFVRNQKVVTLSSGEAELVALTQVVSEAILIKKVWNFLTELEVDMIARTDSSVARAIAQRAGVGRVRHLQTSCLWIQQWCARRELKVLAIPTEKNPADVGTKVLTASRLRMLCGTMGMVNGGGSLIGAEVQGDGQLTRDQAKLALRLVQAVLATQLQGCAPGGDDRGGLNYDMLVNFMAVVGALLDYFIDSFIHYVSVFGYVLDNVGGGYLVIFGGLWILVLIGYLVLGTSWRITFTWQSGRSGLEPGCGDGEPSSEGATLGEDAATLTPTGNIDLVNDAMDDEAFDEFLRNASPGDVAEEAAHGRKLASTSSASSTSPTLATSAATASSSTAPFAAATTTSTNTLPASPTAFANRTSTTSPITSLAPNGEEWAAVEARLHTWMRENIVPPRPQPLAAEPGVPHPQPAQGQAQRPANNNNQDAATQATDVPAGNDRGVQGGPQRQYPVQPPDRPRHDGRRDLTQAELNQNVWITGSGYAFHLHTCRCFRGSARSSRQMTMREAINRRKKPCQQCMGGIHIAMFGNGL